MAKGFKGITVEIDGSTSKLDSALSKVNSTSKSLQTELKGVNSLLKLDPTNTELAAQKQMLLSQAVQQTEEKLKLLETAQKQTAAAGADINDEAYRNLQREIVLTKSKLEDLKGQKKTFDELQKGAESFGTKVANIANKIPIVNKLTTAFGQAKAKITDTVKESATVQKIGSAVEGAKKKVEDFKNAHPAVQKVADAFGKVKEKADELRSKLPSVSQAMTALGNASKAAAEGGFKVLQTTVGGTMKAFAGFSSAVIGGATALGAYAVSQASTLDNIDKMSQRLGLSREEFQKWDFVLSQSGVDINSFQTGMKTLTKNMDAVSEGNKTAIENFKKLGIEVQNADGSLKTQSETLLAAVEAFQKMPESTEKARLAQELFGKQGQEIMPLLNSESGSVEELMAKCEELGIVISDEAVDAGVKFTDTLDQLKRSAQGLFNTFVSTGVLTTFTNGMQTAMGALGDLMTAYKEDGLEGLLEQADDTVGDLVQQVSDEVADSVPQLIEVATTIITSLVTTLANNIPNIVNGLLPPLLNGFFSLISAVIASLPELVPRLLEAAITFFMGIITGLNTVIPQLAAQIPVIINQITTTLTENLPQIIQAGILILVNLINGITNAIPSLIEAIIALFPVITTALLENLPLIIEAGLNLLIALITGIVQAIPQLIAMLPQIITTIVSTLASMLPQIIEAGITLLNSLISGIIQAIPQLIAALPQIISSIVNTLIKNLPQIISAGIQLLGALISGLIQAIPSLVAAIPQIVKAIFDTFKAVNWGELGKNIIDGVINGVKNAASSLINVFKDLASSALDAVKDFFGIHSPSTVMRDQVGKMLPAGMAEGVEEGMDDEEERIRKAMEGGVPTTIDSYINTKPRPQPDGSTGGTGGFVQNLTINSPRELSPSETARQTRIATRQMVLKLKPT